MTGHPFWAEVDRVLDAGLQEDVAGGDVTTDVLFDVSARARARIAAKQGGVIAGLPVARRVFARLDPGAVFESLVGDGALVEPGTAVATVSCRQRALLTGERLALNLLQRMSGIATLARRYVEAVAGLNVRILDTRKTAPGLRALDKYAVRVGGAENHRMTLHDLAMVKDNHIRLAGGIAPAVRGLRERGPAGLRVEVETSTLGEVRQALDAGADIVMLDNMDLAAMRDAVKLIAGRAVVEASGSVSLESVRAIAETGVNCISVGRLTHSAPALDISLKVLDVATDPSEDREPTRMNAKPAE